MTLPEIHYHRLLVAVDDTPGAALALAAGVTVARRDNAELTLVSVAPNLTATAASWPSPGADAAADAGGRRRRRAEDAARSRRRRTR